MDKLKFKDQDVNSGVIKWPVKLQIEYFICISQIAVLENISLKNLKALEDDSNGEKKYTLLQSKKEEYAKLQTSILREVTDWNTISPNDKNIQSLVFLSKTIHSGILDPDGLTSYDERLRYVYYTTIQSLLEDDIDYLDRGGNLRQIRDKSRARSILWFLLREKGLSLHVKTKNNTAWNELQQVILSTIITQTNFSINYDYSTWKVDFTQSLINVKKSIVRLYPQHEKAKELISFIDSTTKEYKQDQIEDRSDQEVLPTSSWNEKLNSDKEYKKAKSRIDKIKEIKSRLGKYSYAPGLKTLVDRELKIRQSELKLAEKKFTKKHYIRKLQKDLKESPGQLALKTVLNSKVQSFIGESLGFRLAKMAKGEKIDDEAIPWKKICLSGVASLGPLMANVPGGPLLQQFANSFLQELLGEKEKTTKDFIEDAVAELSDKINELKNQINNLKNHIDDRFDKLTNEFKDEFSKQESQFKAILRKEKAHELLDNFNLLFSEELYSLNTRFKDQGVVITESKDFDKAIKFLTDFESSITKVIRVFTGATTSEFLLLTPHFTMQADASLWTLDPASEKTAATVSTSNSYLGSLRDLHAKFPSFYTLFEFITDTELAQQQLQIFINGCFQLRTSLQVIVATAFAQEQYTDESFQNITNGKKTSYFTLLEDLYIKESKYTVRGSIFQFRILDQVDRLQEYFLDTNGVITLQYLRNNGLFQLHPAHLQNKNLSLYVGINKNEDLILESDLDSPTTQFRLTNVSDRSIQISNRACKGEIVIAPESIENSTTASCFLKQPSYSWDLKQIQRYSDFYLRIHEKGYFSLHPHTWKLSNQVALDVFDYAQESGKSPLKVCNQNDQENQLFKIVFIDPTQVNMKMKPATLDSELSANDAITVLGMTKDSSLTADFVTGSSIQSGLKYYSKVKKGEKSNYYLILNPDTRNLEIRGCQDEKLYWQAVKNPPSEGQVITAHFQDDGNFSLYKQTEKEKGEWGDPTEYWSSNTSGYYFSELRLIEEDGMPSLIIENSNGLPVWKSHPRPWPQLFSKNRTLSGELLLERLYWFNYKAYYSVIDRDCCIDKLNHFLLPDDEVYSYEARKTLGREFMEGSGIQDTYRIKLVDQHLFHYQILAIDSNDDQLKAISVVKDESRQLRYAFQKPDSKNQNQVFYLYPKNLSKDQVFVSPRALQAGDWLRRSKNEKICLTQLPILHMTANVRTSGENLKSFLTDDVNAACSMKDRLHFFCEDRVWIQYSVEQPEQFYCTSSSKFVPSDISYLMEVESTTYIKQEERMYIFSEKEYISFTIDEYDRRQDIIRGLISDKWGLRSPIKSVCYNSLSEVFYFFLKGSDKTNYYSCSRDKKDGGLYDVTKSWYGLDALEFDAVVFSELARKYFFFFGGKQYTFAYQGSSLEGPIDISDTNW